jgi:DNA repair protein RecN (Recombination protein N)
MLRELRINNLAIIDDLKVRFGKGLNVITGETGAGKSIIVDSLGLALGGKAQPDLIRSGEKEAVIQAFFDTEGVEDFPDIGIDISDGLILRRSISASGRSRSYANDTIISLQSLGAIGASLVDIHGQHEYQSLLSVDKQRGFLDSFGKLQKEKEEVEALYKQVDILKRESADLRQSLKDRAQRLDLLRFQVNEIDSASLRDGEREALDEKKKIMSNLGKLNELAAASYSMIYGEDSSCVERLSSIISKAKEMSSIDSSSAEILDLLESALPLVEDAAVFLRGYKDRYEFDPDKLSEIEDRFELVRKLEKKYGEGIENIIRYRDEAEKEMKGLELVDEKLDRLESDLKVKEEMLSDSASRLSEKRKETAKRMEKLIMAELKELAFGDAEFVIDMKPEKVSAYGMDKVEFLFSANPGEPAKPLSRIASGGELSRVMLSLKTVLADFDNVPVMIFDEVDAGVGGKTGESVGKKLKAIADRHQVLCTTHLPQIASMGDFHIKTEKKQKNERVFVEVRELAGRERLQEIARMLSGKITDVSLKHAKELIESGV